MDNLESSPLTQNQQPIWFDHLTYPDSPAYNIGGRLDIDGEVNHSLMEQAVRLLIRENDALRIAIQQPADGGPRQTVRQPFDYHLPFLDFSTLANPEQAASDWLINAFGQALPTTTDRLYWQFALIRIHARHHALLTKYHHLIADGWSTKIVIDRLAYFYNALLEQQPPILNPSVSYLEFVEHERQYLDSAAYQRDQAFWRSALPVLPEPLIQHKHAMTVALERPKALLHRFNLGRDFYDQLSQWAGTHQATTYHLLLTALCLYFARIQQQSTITVGIPALNRSGARFKSVLGMFASLSALTVDIDTDVTISQLLRHLSKTIRQVHKHQRYPLSAMTQQLNLLKHKRENLFDLVLSFERQDYAVRFGEASVRACQLFSQVARYPLAVTICEFNDAHDVEVIFEGAETCFNAEELAQLSERLIHVLQQFLATPTRRLMDVDLVPEAEKRRLLTKFNPPHPLPPFVDVISQFRHWVNETPQANALCHDGRCLNFAAVEQQSNRLAHGLQSRGCTPGQLIAVCMPRCIEGIIALLAIFKIRAIYLPMDNDSPLERLRYQLQQSQASMLLTVGSNGNDLTGLHPQMLRVDEELATTSSAHACLSMSVVANDLAYVIYTSGSSGQPKGSLIDHRALSTRLTWLQKNFNIQPHERVGQTIQSHFDPSLIEIFLALTQGACLVLPPWQRVTPEAFSHFVLSEKINALALVPSSLRALLQGLPDNTETPLRVACCGGEVLPGALARQFIQRTGAKLFNVYGPTEATILASAWCCSENDHDPLPIGRPIDHTQILITDQQLKLLPLGVPGEIVIGGPGVGRGYLGQTALSQAAFLANPYSQDGTDLLYRTGDRGYVDSNGVLYFSERLDRQIKIGGYRIEPAEIENVLRQHALVKQAAVVAFTGAQQQKTLAAYVSVDETAGDTLKNELSALLRSRLPDYMQPHSISLLSSLPTNAAGKIAYAELPPPQEAAPTASSRAPGTELEAQLLAIWRETLKNPDIGIDDNFFEQAVDSLTAMTLLSRIEAALGCRQSIAFLMAFPSVASQAAQLAATQAPIDMSLISTLSKTDHAPPFYLAASGYGDQLRFQALADALGDCCTLHILYPPRSIDEHLSIEAIATHYAKAIIASEHDSVYLGGFSIGGITALETARLLEQQGRAPRRLILLDTVYPLWPLQSPWLFKALQWLSGLGILNRFSLNDRRVHAILTDPGIILQLQGLAGHKLTAFQGSTALIMSRQMRWLCPWLFSAWRALLGNQLMRFEVSGLHGAIFRPRHLTQLAEIIRHSFTSP